MPILLLLLPCSIFSQTPDSIIYKIGHKIINGATDMVNIFLELLKEGKITKRSINESYKRNN